jgi:hypothetical protein
MNMDDLEAHFESLKEVFAERTPPGLPDIEFRQARRKRRRALDLATFLVALLVVGGLLVALRPGGSSNLPHLRNDKSTSPPSTVSPESELTSISLPKAYWFNQISVPNGAIVLTGQKASSNTGSTSCVVATLNPHTLKLTRTASESCDDPAILGETVMAVNTNLPDSSEATIRIAVLDPKTGQVSEGPVIMTYGYFSDTRPVMTYGGGQLWIYDVDTTKGPELFQISGSSGRVDDTVAMPALYRPLLAANDDGAWIGNSIEGSPSSALLYRVSPGSSSAVGIVRGSSQYVFWLQGSGNSLWAGIGPVYSDQTIWAFDGSDTRPVFRVPDHGYDATIVVGTQSDGLWTVGPYPALGSRISPGKHSEAVVRIDPRTGKETLVATLPPMVLPLEDAGLVAGQDAFFEGSLFVLEPPFRANGYLGYSTVLRIRI